MKIRKTAERITEYLNKISEKQRFLWLTLVYVFWRILSLEPIESAGDALAKWRFLRQWIECGTTATVHLGHQQGRWGLNLPVAGIMKLFGSDIAVYYIFPLLTGFLTGILVYLIVSRFSSKANAFYAFLLYLVFPHMAHECTQFMPQVPSTMFVLAAYLLTMSVLENKWKEPWLLWAGILLGCAYGCKETSLYWAFAFGLFLLFFTPSGKGKPFWRKMIQPSVLWFSAGVLAVLILEFICLNAFFNLKMGRLELVSMIHKPYVEKIETGKNLLEYLISFFYPIWMHGKFIMTLPHAMLMLTGIFGALLWVRDRNPAKKLAGFTFITVYLLHAYLVYKVFPFRYPERFLMRYYIILLTFSIVFLFSAQDEMAAILKKWIPERGLRIVSAGWVLLIVTMSLVCFGNCWKNGENPLNLAALIKMQRDMKKEPLPVLVEYSSKPLKKAQVYDARDMKNTFRWRILLYPPENLNLYQERPELYTDGTRVYTTSVNPGKIREGIPSEVYLVRKEKIRKVKTILTRSGFQFTD